MKNKTHQKRVAAIHDLSGFGKCSLTVALPILSAAGIEAAALPTAILSTHTGGISGYTYRDLTNDMRPIMKHWKSLDLRFDAIYTGFLGSFEQQDIVKEFFDMFRRDDNLILVDPVMGDNGELYTIFTREFAAGMRSLCEKADIIVPNLTEAALLLEEDYADLPRDEEGLRAWLERLSLDGRRSVVLTGVSLRPGAIGAGCFDRATGRIRFAMARQEPAQFPGTGDLFASVVLGAMLRGEPLETAAQRAAEFVQRCAAHTLALGTPVLEGVQFEPLLGELMQR